MRRGARHVLAAALALASTTAALSTSEAQATALPSLLPSCAYGTSVPGLVDYEQAQVTADAWHYANGLSGVSAARRRSEATVFAAAEAAYIYGLPLVDVHATVKSFLLRNTIITADSLSTAGNRLVVSPNVDTVYSVANLDLLSGPVVIDVPDTGGRFYTFQFMDAYSNSFAYVGSGATGTRAGSYAVVPPGWHGQLPGGVHAIQSPTNTVWLLGRTLVRNAPDLATVKPTLEQYRATPLAAWVLGTRGLSVVLPTTPNRTKAPTPTGAGFISVLNQELTIDPPPAGDACALKAFAPAGVTWPGTPGVATQLVADALNATGLTPAAPSSSSPAAVTAGTSAAVARIAHAEATLFRTEGAHDHGWTAGGSWVGNYGTRWLARAIIAQDLLGANTQRIAMYPTNHVDSQGRPLTGARRYTITFPAHSLPPVNAFWSLTMYGADNFLVDNSINRYAIGNRTAGLRLNRDGSLTLYLQSSAPSGAERANWLPAPRGPFHVILRLYLPRTAALTGRWLPPAIVAH